jgi:hypothetical protein
MVSLGRNYQPCISFTPEIRVPKRNDASNRWILDVKWRELELTHLLSSMLNRGLPQQE